MCRGAYSDIFYLQSLVIPFAFLINNQRDTILDLVEPLNINGRSGLDVLLNTWCENAETFQGYWPSRISTLALTQLLLSERPSIHNMIVKGDMILKAETKNGESFMLSVYQAGVQEAGFLPSIQSYPVIMTRSRTKTSKGLFISSCLQFASPK